MGRRYSGAHRKSRRPVTNLRRGRGLSIPRPLSLPCTNCDLHLTSPQLTSLHPSINININIVNINTIIINITTINIIINTLHSPTPLDT
jgi:hypothetical protein